MSVTRDFDAMVAEKTGDKPTFKIAGQTFTMRSKLPYAKWNKLLQVMRGDDVDAMDATRQFFDTCLIRADRARFAELLDSEDEDDDEAVIGIVEMNELTDWAMEHFTGKLLSNSPGSSPGSGGTGASRNVVSLSARTSAG